MSSAELLVARHFLEKLSSAASIEVVLIHGNHDVNLKSDSLVEHNSILSSIVPHRKNIQYVDTEQVVTVKGVTIHCCPWTLSNEPTYREADIFMGHSAIAGMQTDTWTFTHGFKQEDLYKHYPLSLCGDIHHKYLFSGYSPEGSSLRYAIQSGTLHQNSWGDSHECGFWLIDYNETTKEVVSEPLFINNKELPHAEHYYEWRTVDVLPTEQERILTRPCRLTPQKNKLLKEIVQTAEIVSLQQRFKEFTVKNNLDDYLVPLFEEMHNKATIEESLVPTGVTLQSVKAKNFLSIGELEYKFPQTDDTLIVGPNGVGKAQPLYSKIKTPDGWTTMGEIKVGDKVDNAVGGVATVIGVYPQGKRDIYEITLDNGAKTRCCKEHLWQVHTFGAYIKRKIESGLYFHSSEFQKVMTLEQLMRASDDDCNLIPILVKDGIWEYWTYCPIKSIELVAHEEAQCIMVDSAEHLYVTDDNIVTHNTTLMESVFYTLTGNTTKGLTLEEIVHENHSNEDMTTEVTFNRGNDEYVVRRSYRKTSDLVLIKNGEPLRCNHIRETQKLIYNILGTNEEELFLFCYFSVKGYQSFASLGNTAKYGVIAKLAQTNQLDSIRDVLLKETKEVEKHKNIIEGAINELLISETTKKTTYKDILAKKDASQVDIEGITLEKTILESEIATLIEARQEYQTKSSALNLQKQQLQMLSTKVEQLKKDYLEVTKKKNGLLSATCYVCQQKHTPADAEAQLQSLAIQERNIVTEGKASKEKITELQTLIDGVQVAPFNSQSLINAQTKLANLKGVLQSNVALIADIAKLDYIREEIKEVEQKLQVKQGELKVVTEQITRYKALAKIIDKKSLFVTTLLRDTCELINKELDYVLSDVRGFSLALVVDKEIQLQASIGERKNINFNKLSAGETKITEIALISAFQNVFCKVYGLNEGILGYIFLDEIFSYLSAERLEESRTIIEKVNTRRVLITHEVALQSLFPTQVVVSKDGAYSEYLQLGH
jgi:DNA repair exonuclease SbcCD ATPase subunit